MGELTQKDRLYIGCHRYGIQKTPDAMFMDEFTWGDQRFDVLTVDLATWIVRGFEIKVDRGDFLKDRKWQNYLPYVHFFFFAALPGVIDPKELPPEVGLLELEAEGLVLKKRPKRLQPTFVRHTFTELFVTRLLLSWIRNLCWRYDRAVTCQRCGHRQDAGDPRARLSGPMSMRED